MASPFLAYERARLPGGVIGSLQGVAGHHRLWGMAQLVIA